MAAETGWEWWQFLLAYGLPAVSAVVVAYLTILPQLKKNTEAMKSVRAVSHETKEEVKKTTFAITNNHPEHLRDDIDRQFNELRTGIAELTTKLRSLLSLHASSAHRTEELCDKLDKHIAAPVDEAHDLPYYLTKRF